MNGPVPLDCRDSVVWNDSLSCDAHLCILDVRGRIQFCGNPGLFGRTAEELKGQPLSSFIPGLALRDATPGYNLAYVGLWFRNDEWRHHSAVGADGRDIPLEVTLRKVEVDGQHWLLAMLRTAPLADEAGQDVVSRILAAEDESAAVMVTDARGIIEYVNAAFERLSGYSMAELRGNTPAMLRSGIHNPAFYADLWARLAAGQEYRGLVINRKKSGEVYFEDKVIRPYYGADGLVSHYVSSGRDISDRVQNDPFPAAAATTGVVPDEAELPDRRVFFDRLQHALARAARRKARLGVACIKLDASMSDMSPHEQARRLQVITACLQSCLRRSDTAAQIAQGEFALILEDLEEQAAGEVVLARIVDTLRQGVALDGTPLAVAVSIGMSVFPEHGQDELGLLLRADCAMQQANAAGGGRHAVFRNGHREFKLYCNADTPVAA